MSEEADTERKSVKTYVPAYQKEAWADHAGELDMTQSEFVRTMVQAGRRGFQPAAEEPAAEEPASGGSDPGGHALETRVLELLSGDTYTYPELLEAVTNDIESQLQESIERLQSTNRIRHSPRAGGYELVDGGADGD